MGADEQAILQEVSGGVARVTMNRPDRHNAFDDGLIRELTETLRTLADRADLHAVVLTGAGRSFSAGADLHWMRRMAGYTQAENHADALALARLMETLDGLALPVIARVHGAAIGGGVGLVAAADIAIAAEGARFGLSEVRLGLIPAAISPYVVKAIGERQARRYFVTGERFDASDARRIGLVHEVVADESLDQRLEALLGELAANGPRAMGAAKALARRVGRGPVDDAMIEDTAGRIAEIRVGDEAQEGISAFLEKRPPRWRED